MEDAEKLCNAIGGMLPQPRNSGQNDFLNTMIDSPGWFYLGLTDKGHEGRWMWNTESPLDLEWTNWGSGEPDGGTQKNCAFHRVDYGEWSKKWDATWCDHNWAYDTPVICEKRKYTIYHLTKETYE